MALYRNYWLLLLEYYSSSIINEKLVITSAWFIYKQKLLAQLEGQSGTGVDQNKTLKK